ncbi:MAG: phosphatase PAP2 family protein [Acidimicrobiales bacterium]
MEAQTATFTEVVNPDAPCPVHPDGRDGGLPEDQRSPRVLRRPPFWRELATVVAFYVLYELTSDLTAGARHSALAHALGEIHLEQALGIFGEQSIQAFFLPHIRLVQASDLYYATVHFIMPAAVLVWLYWRFPARYRRWRNIMAWLMGVSLIAFLVDPVMPPRLLPASFHFVDTLKKVGGAGRLDSFLLKEVGDAYAAMPSLHVAWASWCAAATVPVVRRRWVKVLLILDPIVTTFVVIVTANHLFLDVVGGLVALAVGIGLARVPWLALAGAGRRRLVPGAGDHGPAAQETG